MRGANLRTRPNRAICLTAPEPPREGGRAARPGSTRSDAAHAVRTLRPAGLTGGAMVRRAYTQRSPVQKLLPPAEKLSDPPPPPVDALLDDDGLLQRLPHAPARPPPPRLRSLP